MEIFRVDMTKMVDDLSQELIGTEVTGRFGTGKIIAITGSNSNYGYGFIGTIQYPTEEKQLSLSIATKSGAIKLPDDKTQVLQEYMDLVETLERDMKLLEEKHRREEREQKEKEEAERKQRERIDKIIERAAESVHTHVKTNDTDLLWLKEHGGKIKAAMPDFLEKWFVSVFGDVKRRVVDQSKVGPAGWTSQWGLSLSMRIKDFQHAPSSISQYINDKGTINNTAFLATLALDHDFTID